MLMFYYLLGFFFSPAPRAHIFFTVYYSKQVIHLNIEQAYGCFTLVI